MVDISGARVFPGHVIVSTWFDFAKVDFDLHDFEYRTLRAERPNEAEKQNRCRPRIKRGKIYDFLLKLLKHTG